MSDGTAPPLERLKEIFHAACELEVSQRGAFLDQACGPDADLRGEIEALLKSNETADGFITDPPSQLAAEAFGVVEIPSAAGRTIGQYKLLERIGSGGMGEVYLAERSDQQFQMQVAIKLIKRGMDTDLLLRRFQHERQILASLEHPNIARLLDGGETEDGLPYLVMEYVKGERIDRYAEGLGLSTTARLELFRQVCSAVSYAHQHLVVHRDLKPSNILVTPEGVPKLLDFGIAKIISEEAGAETFATFTAAPLMTPEYASPEQIEGAPATTLSDVYSLGAVLYELLSGHPPHHLKTRSRQEIAEAITRADVAKPSTIVSRPEDARRLRGDLDNIVLMALRKETSRRYRSIEQFSEDIRRHLIGRPVIARADTVSYRAGKFLQRNKIAVAAGVLILMTLVGGIITTASQARRATIQEQRARAEQARAERRFNDVRKLANRVLFEYHDAIRNLPGSTKARELLVKDGLEYLDSLSGEALGDPALQRELSAAYEKVGDVRGTLGDMAGALESHRKAFSIREALVAANPGDAQARRDLAQSHGKIGARLLATTDEEEAIKHMQEGLAIYLDLTREQPANNEFQLELADAHVDVAETMTRRGDSAGALEQARVGLAIRERVAASDLQDQRYRFELWTSYSAVGYTLYMQEDYAGAVASNEKALALGEALLAEDPLNDRYRRGLVVSYQHDGDFRRTIDKRGSLEAFRRAVALNEEIVAADPANASNRKHLAYTHKRLADSLMELEDYPQALPHFRKASEGYERVATDAPADLISRFLVVTCRAGLARMQARVGEIEPALEGCSQAVQTLQKITGDKTPHLGRAQALEYLGHAYVALAKAPNTSASDARQRTSTARDIFLQALSILEEMRRQQGGLGGNEKWAAEIAGEIAKCEATLSR